MRKKLNIYLVIFLSSVIAVLGVFLIIENFFIPNILFNFDVIDTTEENQNTIFILTAIEAIAILALCYLIVPKYFTWILGAIYIVMAFYTAVEIFDIPNKVLEALDIKEELKIKTAEEATRSTYFLLINTFIVNLIILYRIITQSIKPHEDTIVYVPKYYDTEENEEKDVTQEESIKSIENIKVAMNKGADIEERKQIFLNEVCNELKAANGILYKIVTDLDKRFITLDKGYAFYVPESKTLSFEFGEGLSGQVARTKKPILSNKVPKGYINIVSGLGNSSPNSIIISPLLDGENNLVGVLEISTFEKYTNDDLQYLTQVGQLLTESISA